MVGMKKLLAAIGLAAAASTTPSFAGNIWLTGHDADFHCTGGQQCNHFGTALDFARQGAANKALPLLFLDSGSELSTASANAISKAKNSVEGAGNAFNFIVVDPTSVGFASLAFNAFSAIVVASDSSCGGCDNNAADIAAINARTSDIASFFNAGGGLVYFAGAGNFASYYNSVPVGATAVPVTSPFTLTAAGLGVGLSNLLNDANCCPTHNSFALPGPGSALQVAETDAAGVAETLFASGAVITDGGIVTDSGGGTVPEPASLGLLGLGALAFGFTRRRKQ